MSSCTFIDRPQTRKKKLRLTRESTNQWLHETGETHHPFILQYTTIIWEKSKLELPVYLDISFRVILHRRKKDSGDLSKVFFLQYCLRSLSKHSWVGNHHLQLLNCVHYLDQHHKQQQKKNTRCLFHEVLWHNGLQLLIPVIECSIY